VHEGYTGAATNRFQRTPRTTPAASAVIGFGAALTVLVIGVVPAIAIPTRISPLVPLAIVLGAYGLAAVATGNVVPAVVGSIPVLTTVNADIPIREGPSNTVDLAVVIGDGAVLAGALLLVAWRYRSDATAFTTGRFGGLRGTPGWLRGTPGWLRRGLKWLHRALGWPAVFLTAFAIWALVGAAFAAHDPLTAAVFGVNQLRYVAYFVVAGGLVAAGFATVRTLSVTFVIAVIGHGLYAIAQFAYGHTFGMTALGETARSNQLTIELFGQAMPMGRFLGGLVGNNAAFASLAIPAVAVLVWIAVDADPLLRGIALGGIGLLGALCVPLSQYDSVALGFAVTLSLAVGLASIRFWPHEARRFVRRQRGPLLVGSIVGTIAAIAAAIAVGAGWLPDVLPFVEGRNLDTRLADYRRAIELGVEHPVFGYGGGNVEPVGAELGFSGDFAIHSIALSYLAETGFIGLALWLGAVVAIGSQAVRLAWSDHPDAALAAALCVGALGFLVVGSFDQLWDNHTSMGVFWLFAGAIAGSYGELARRRGGSITQDSRR
jgi:hypothetical protein